MGFKGLSSVIAPPNAPKADLLALTGGYRRALVLQIGADIYCDSALIAAELDQRFPACAIGPNTAGKATPLLDNWADRFYSGKWFVTVWVCALMPFRQP